MITAFRASEPQPLQAAGTAVPLQGGHQRCESGQVVDSLGESYCAGLGLSTHGVMIHQISPTASFSELRAGVTDLACKDLCRLMGKRL